MKASELRIGNWVMGNAPYQVSLNEMSLNHQYLKMGKEPYFNPIPLTKEWLIKFGFKQEQGWDDMIYFINNGIDVYPIEDGFEFYGCDVKHVNQLQNLYHALIGEELTMKE